jgi:hypothetical protein
MPSFPIGISVGREELKQAFPNRTYPGMDDPLIFQGLDIAGLGGNHSQTLPFSK